MGLGWVEGQGGGGRKGRGPNAKIVYTVSLHCELLGRFLATYWYILPPFSNYYFLDT